MPRKKPETPETPDVPETPVDLSIQEQTTPVVREPVVDEPFAGIKRVNY